MKKLTRTQFDSIRTWIYRNARNIDLLTFQCLFEKGKTENVVETLKYYQNSDGGFGNALESDCWNTESSPYTTEYAVKLLEIIGFIDYSHPIYHEIAKFFTSRQHYSENTGWNFSIPGNDNFPHAPWWNYNEENNKFENIGLTAFICNFLLKYSDKSTNISKAVLTETKSLALSTAEKIVHPALETNTKHGEMSINGFISLINTMNSLSLLSVTDYNKYHSQLCELVSNTIERDITKWKYYGIRPSKYIQSPESCFYKENRTIMETELDFLIETLPTNSVWPITWSWFDNNIKYQKEFAISENWWRSVTAYENLLLLRNFGRLDGISFL